MELSEAVVDMSTDECCGGATRIWDCDIGVSEDSDSLSPVE